MKVSKCLYCRSCGSWYLMFHPYRNLGPINNCWLRWRYNFQVYAATGRDICQIWSHNKLSHCRWKAENSTTTNATLSGPNCNQSEKQNPAFEIVDGIYFMGITFAPKKLRNINGNRTPKCILTEICKEKRLPSPSFETVWKRTIALPHPTL